MIKHDGHIHSHYCPHGSSDSFAQYCEQAIQKGLTGITFTEHAPLPKGFIDPTPTMDSAMDERHLTSYIEELQAIQSYYKSKLTVLIGLEIDFVEGFELETKQFLDTYGPFLDDSILSVHFLKIEDIYYCMDYSPDTFKTCSDLLGSVDHVYQLYYETLKKSVQANLGTFKPTRIGHITLCEKFQKKYPATKSYRQDIQTILSLIHQKGYQLDYNGAGTLKPLCGLTYPSAEIAEAASEMGIPLVYGSDAHQVKGMFSGVDMLSTKQSLSSP
ncbi:histidinol-phosphatase HisJ [Alkalihalophilus sp. As8PL]|uniref:Histidinol-phosphatase n=1 Tax=Alkalihalophilus sp. As8PL TaxID=3237103 RepID=A0AB39BQ67_9BACI